MYVITDTQPITHTVCICMCRYMHMHVYMYTYISFVLSIYDSKKDYKEIFLILQLEKANQKRMFQYKQRRFSHINKYSFFIALPFLSLCDCSCPKLFQMLFCIANSPTFFCTAKQNVFRDENKFFPDFSSYQEK